MSNSLVIFDKLDLEYNRNQRMDVSIMSDIPKKRLSISEVITHTSRMETDEEQVEWLKKYDNPMIRLILKIWYRDEFKLRIPSTRPPFSPSPSTENHLLLYSKGKDLMMIVEGVASGLNQLTLEGVFIRMLESIHAEDAELIVQMISKKPLPYLSKEVIQKAYPEIFV